MTHIPKIHLKSRNGICPLCSKKTNGVITHLDRVHADIYEMDLYAPFRLLQCYNCGLVFQNDIFTEESEKDIFINYYDNIPKQSIETDNDDTLDYEVKILSSFIGYDRRLLDFGSFWGGFAKKAIGSFNIFCYELGKKKIEKHKELGLNILDSLEGQHFDIIRVGNVLSHLHNNMFNILNSLMEKTEYIYIIDWNGDCELNEFTPHCKPLWHVNTFTKESLKYIQNLFNLKIIYKDYTKDHFGVIYGKQ